MEDIGVIVGFILTLMVFSYLLGDNVLYRLAVYVFVGMTAGYIAIVTVESVLIPWFDSTIGSGNTIEIGFGLLPVLLGLMLLFKTSSRLGRLGNLGIAFIIGVGTAVAVIGAIIGTLIPLVTETADASGKSTLDAILIFVGVASSLVYFQYNVQRLPNGEIRQSVPIQLIRTVGQGFIIITLGALYGAAIITSLTIFSERVGFLLSPLLGN